MHGCGSYSTATSYNILTSKWNNTALGLIEMHVNDKCGSTMHLGWNKYNLKVFIPYSISEYMNINIIN